MNLEPIARDCESQLSVIRRFLGIALEPIVDNVKANELLQQINQPYRSLLQQSSLASLEIQRIRVEAALERLVHDEFGYCCQCGEDIEPQRLRNDPPTPFCLDCFEALAERKSRSAA